MSDKIFNEEERDELRGEFLNGVDFDGEGMELRIISKEAIKSDNPRFGAKEDGRGLKRGETWEYTFETLQGARKTFKNGSARLAAALARLNPSSGDAVRIKRSGEGTETKWIVARPGSGEISDEEIVEV